MTAPGPPARRLVYVCYEHPVLTQTFTAAEISGLREEGLGVEVVSCRRPRGGPPAAGVLYLPGPLSAAARSAFLRAASTRPRALAGILAAVTTARYRDEAARCFVRGFGQALWGAWLAERTGPAHFHAQFVDAASTVAWAAARLAGGSFSFTNHTAYNPYLLGPKLEDAAVAFSISEFDRRLLLAQSGERGAGRLRVAYQGIDTARWRVERKGAGGPGGWRVLSVGALREKKGHHVLLEALAILARDDVPIRTTIVGDGPERPRLRAAAARLGLEGRVEFTGPESPERVRERLGAADVFALACCRARNGDLDGIPIALMEAMAAGVPVVSTRISGIPELVQDGVEGRLARPGDPGDFARVLGEALDDREASAAMAERARGKVTRQHERRRTVHAVAGLLAEAMR